MPTLRLRMAEARMRGSMVERKHSGKEALTLFLLQRQHGEGQLPLFSMLATHTPSSPCWPAVSTHSL